MTPSAWKTHDSEVTKLKSLPFSSGPFLFSQSTSDGKLCLWNFEMDDQNKMVASFNKHGDAPMSHFDLFQSSQLVGVSSNNRFISYEKAFSSHSNNDVRSEKLVGDVVLGNSSSVNSSVSAGGVPSGPNSSSSNNSANFSITALAALPINRLLLVGTDSGA